MERMTGYVHSKMVRADGSLDCFVTTTTEAKVSPLDWQLRALQFTSSGYGSRIPTQYMVKYAGRWRRVYIAIYSNSGTMFIGRKLNDNGECKIVNIESEF